MVPSTEHGVVCGRCTRANNETPVRHASTQAVRQCYTDGSAPALPWRPVEHEPLVPSLRAVPDAVQADEPAAVPSRAPQRPQVVPGRYALEISGVLTFLQVRVGTGPRWEGHIFVDRLIGAPGDWQKSPVRGESGRTMLRMIAADPQAAVQRYAHEFTTCARCDSPLSDETSRAVGLGPDCRRHHGL